IAPLMHYPIRGVLWYQGETNTYEPALYRKLLPALIADWRKGWGVNDMPFYFAQLSGFPAWHEQPRESRWAELREAQAPVQAPVPKPGMVVTIDLADPHDMHPPNKKEIAHRFALLAESQLYGKTGVNASGPVCSGMQIKDGNAVPAFSHTAGGLVDRN